jgi:hypothetical protein
MYCFRQDNCKPWKSFEVNLTTQIHSNPFNQVFKDSQGFPQVSIQYVYIYIYLCIYIQIIIYIYLLCVFVHHLVVLVFSATGFFQPRLQVGRPTTFQDQGIPGGIKGFVEREFPKFMGKILENIRVCLKMGYTPNYSHLIGIMIINHWV